MYTEQRNGGRSMVKRSFDLVCSLSLLFITFPIIGVCALLVRRKLGTPVLFKQERPGLHGKPFHIYKFRTMTDERDGQGELLPDDVRLTRFGRLLRKLSLDELPQLFNVVKGDISLVGPRPLLMEYLPRYTPRQARRHEVKPGITGWAQVNGRNAISWEEKFELDVWYVENRSFWLDLKILWLTFFKVVRSEGVSKEGHATMTKFMGQAQTHENERKKA
ncbi:bacterial sugar transferase [Aneurinibacillus aneurinilyticus ATCC 12856]|uniref:Bacterial sugar transferase n=2 Tax=Aneurinibacillus aneurinilyticus TaxID=1391 RepID=U1WWI7_ANEAE|nr:bacterial sugar transferase [Aneurinibacillus aneurinilyticus ATCC 12856]